MAAPVLNWARSLNLAPFLATNRGLVRRQMDFWCVLLAFAFMAGIMGWIMTPFVNGILWFCDWRDGNDVNWGLEAAFTFAGPCAWMFAIFEIIVLYSK